jgi:uncharacterized protein YyaL (SSP411 family)
MKVVPPALSLRHKLGQVRPLRLILQDAIGLARQPEHDHRTHLRAAIDWLCRVHDQQKMSRQYPHDAARFENDGDFFAISAPYVIETFIAAAQALVQPELLDRANAMLDAHLAMQAADGSFSASGGQANAQSIFKHGQILHGLIAGYQSLGRQESLDAGLRTARWLVAQQDNDGCFCTLEAHGTPHVYNTRALWALAALGVLANEPRLVHAARRKLDWALSQQTPSGWFANNVFMPGQHAALHSIAHAIRGFIEVGILLDEPTYLAAGERAARALMTHQRDNGGLPGIYDDGWTPTGRHICLPGLAHMTLCWLRLAQITGDQRYREAAWRAMAYLKCSQRISDKDLTVRGALLGTTLEQEGYSRFGLPHWATKFFADALMMDMTNVAIPPDLSHHRMTR